MKLHSVAVTTSADHVRLSGEVERAGSGERAEVYFQFPLEYRDFVHESADPFAIAMLVPATLAGEPIEFAPPLSRETEFNLRRVQGVLHAWHARLRPVPIAVAALADDPHVRGGRAATFFSGGVDSFYTLLKYTAGTQRLPVPLTHVIMMRGIETKLDRIREVEAAERSTADAAAAVGVRCVFGETNIRTVFRAHWENYYSGSGLCATAHALSRGFEYVCIPSGMNYRNVVARGSSAVLDEKFSTPWLRILYDGAEASRPEKTALAVEWAPDVVLPRLRVCTRNAGGDYNCGRCYKCVRTAVALAAIGRWQDASTFPDKSMTHWQATMAKDQTELLEENYDFVRARAADPALVAMLTTVVRRHRRHEALRAFVRSSPASHLLTLARRLRSRPA